ncbi:DUF2637 domain-containing protein [Streptomyces sp. NPDC004533]|uniref:DUF2637 domain-containing protein n=1 Tax=Streptomyces sp. NPDC004533 TaxID=3154278 RepID=UPI0033A2D2CB
MPRSLRFDAVLVQAVIAGALSFSHLHDLADAAGQGGWKAWAYPISVDLLLVAAWRRLRSHGPSRPVWCWFLTALIASLGANIATAGLLDLQHVPAWLRILVAGWPALAFMGGTLLAHGPRATKVTEQEAAAAVDAPSESVRVEVDRTPAPEPEVPAAVDTAPARSAVELAPAPEPAPAVPAPASASVPSVPAALVDHARKVADAHQARTGAPIDTDTLRVRLGVPAPLADAIAAQLT